MAAFDRPSPKIKKTLCKKCKKRHPTHITIITSLGGQEIGSNKIPWHEVTFTTGPKPE